ncbi:MAG: hypothetical protein ABI900_10295 [Betaproteobacteria bacterium]
MRTRIFVVALCCWSAAAGAQAPREAHGSHDAYAARGIALAWGVLRGADEANTAIVVRIVADPNTYPWLAVTAIDPFSKQEQPLLRPVQAAGPSDLRIPRPQFADYPRTEFRLFDSAAHAQGNAPQLVVYYLGVPDTTPEFSDPAKLDASLSERIARARAASGDNAP